MATCVSIKIPKSKLCVGDMRHSIGIYSRDITPPVSGSVDFGENFTPLFTVRSAIKTINGRQFFDNTNTVSNITHEFYIRRIPSLDIQAGEHWIRFGSENYNIIRVTRVNERSLFVLIECNVRGDESLPVNFS